MIISASWLDLEIINEKKRNCRIVDFAVAADHRINSKENKEKDKYLDLARELKKTMDGDGDNNYSLIKIDQDTEKSSGDL